MKCTRLGCWLILNAVCVLGCSRASHTPKNVPEEEIQNRRPESGTITREPPDKEHNFFSVDMPTYATAIQRAQESLSGGDLAEARTHLDRYLPSNVSPDVRGIEWYYLNSQFRRNHRDQITAIGFSPKSLTIATTGYDHTINLWDAVDGDLLHSLLSPSGPPEDLTQEEQLAVAGGGEIVGLMQSAAVQRAIRDGGDPREAMERYSNEAMGVDTPIFFKRDPEPDGFPTLRKTYFEFSPDGRLIASARWSDTKIRLWDVETGNKRATLERQFGIRCLRFSPTRQWLASGGSDASVRIWDIDSLTQVATIERDHEVLSIDFDGHGDRLAVGTARGEVSIWNTATWEMELSLSDGDEPVWSVNWSSNGKAIAATYAGATSLGRIYKPAGVTVWHLATPDKPQRYGRNVNGVSRVAKISANGHRIGIWQDDGVLELWTSEKNSIERSLGKYGAHSGYGRPALLFSPLGDLLVACKKEAASEDIALRVWETKTGQELLCRTFRRGVQPRTFALSPDGQMLAVSFRSAGFVRNIPSEVEVWDLNAREMRLTLNKIQPAVPMEPKRLLRPESRPIVAISPNGQIIARPFRYQYRSPKQYYAHGYGIQLWAPFSEEPIVELKGHKDLMEHVAFSPDSKRVVSSSYDKTVKVWNVESGGLLWERIDDTRSRQYAPAGPTFSPDASMIAMASVRRRTRTLQAEEVANPTWSVSLYDAESGELVRSMESEYDKVTDLAFSADGSRLAIATDTDEEPTVRVSDTATGQVIGRFGGRAPVVFSTDGRYIASGAASNEIAAIWSASNYQQHCLIGESAKGRKYSLVKMCFSPDSQRLAVSIGGDVHISEPESGQHLLTIRDQGAILGFSEDGYLWTSKGTRIGRQ